jgi:hypothetical protein
MSVGCGFRRLTERAENFRRGNVVKTVDWGADLGPDIRANK